MSVAMSPTVWMLVTSAPVSWIPYRSSTIWASSARSSESTSMSVSLASLVTCSRSAPRRTSSSVITSSTAGLVVSCGIVAPSGWLSGGQAPVDVEGAGVDVCGVLAGEKRRAGGYLLGLPGALRGHRVQERGTEACGHVRFDQAGGERVDRHAAARDLDRDRVAHGDQPGLCGGVVGLARVRARADDRSDVDDAPVPRADHRAQRQAGEPECGVQVRLDHIAPFALAEREREVVGADSRVVHEAQHRPQPARGVEQPRRACRVGDIAADRERIAAGRENRLLDALRGGPVAAVVDRHRPAVFGQRAGDRGADAARGAGDERACVRRPAHPPHPSMSAAPHVKPAPTAHSSTLLASASRPSELACSRARGTLAAEVLPSSAIASTTLPAGIWSRSVRALVIRALAWWNTNRSTSSRGVPAVSQTRRVTSSMRATAWMNVSWPCIRISPVDLSFSIRPAWAPSEPSSIVHRVLRRPAPSTTAAAP